MSERDSQPAEPLVEPLTRREREILALLGQGLSAPEIAEQLTLAVSSVKWHIQQLYGKLGVNSKQKAVVRASELGLLAAPAAAAAPGPAQPTPEPPPAPAQRHNLPVQVTHFFGREAEIEQLRVRLAAHRLVTLTGSGGVGKTRLSYQAAEAVLDDFPDGVWLVELAPLSDPALIAQQVAGALGVRDEPGRPILEALMSHLSERQTLLVLDNCEHLLEGCARLADWLLRGSPRLKILASSRELLGSAGEAVFHVPSLSFPDPAHLPAISELDNYIALRLFLDRARLLVPDYKIEVHNAVFLARICQRLDGIPPAIEMAAARINVLTAEQLAGRLDDAFRLLTGGSRSALPRQKTLRATIDWSYQLLTDSERLLLLRLSIFAGGCTLEAAEAVCAGDSLEPDQVLDLLASLVAKSMVVADRQPAGGLRYRLLETVRQYAEEKLYDAGQSAQLRTRHRDYFLTLCDKVYKVRYQVAERKWSALLNPEPDNLRLALEWSLRDETAIEAAPRLALGIICPWPTHRETIDWIKRVLAWCDAHPQLPAALRMDVLTLLTGPIAQDDPQSVIDWLKQAVAIGRTLGLAGRNKLVVALFVLASQYHQAYLDAESALPLVQEVEALAREIDADPTAPPMAEMRWAYLATLKSELASDQGHYREAEAYADEAIRLFQAGEQVGDSHGALVDRAVARQNLGEYGLARDDLLHALALYKQSDYGHHDARHQAYITRRLAGVDLLSGNLELARQEGLASLRQASQYPDYNIIASNLALMASMAAKQGQSIRAAKLAGAAQAMYARQHRKPWEDSSLDTLFPGWRDGPDHAAISQAFEAGQALSAEQAVALATDEGVE